MKNKFAIFALGIAAIILMGASIPSNYSITIPVSAMPGATFGAKLLSCANFATAVGATQATCDARDQNVTPTITSSLNLSSFSGIEWLLPADTTITASAGVTVTSGSNMYWKGGGTRSTIFDFTAWTSGSAPNFAASSVNDVVFDGFQVNGNRINSGDTPIDGNGGNCFTSQTAKRITWKNLYLNNCGNLGISANANDDNYVSYVFVEQASDVAIQFNSGDGLLHQNIFIDHLTLWDNNTSNHSGNGQLNIASSGGLGLLRNVQITNFTGQNLQDGHSATLCSGGTLATRSGCGQMIQILPRVNDWKVIGFQISQSWAECIATGGVGGEIADGREDHCNQAGGGGAGGIAIYSDIQPFTGDINVHDLDITDSGYCVSLLLGNTAAQDGNVFGSIHVHHINCGTITDSTGSGIRLVNASCSAHTAGVCNAGAGGCAGNSRACQFSMQDVVFDHWSIRDVLTPINYAAANGGVTKEGLTSGYFLMDHVAILNAATGYIADCMVSGASPLQCGGAETGTVSIAVGASSVTVNDSRVTNQSRFKLTEQPSLGTQLNPSVTGNTTTGRTYTITAVSPLSSFTITSSAVIAANPAVINFEITN